MQGVEPTEICAGDSVIWSRTVDGYPPSANWALTYYLQMNGNAVVSVPTTPDGSQFDVNVPGATSGVWPAGQYSWKAVISGTGANAGKRFTVDMGQLVVLPDPTQTSDSRSHARKCYELVTKEIETRAADSITRYKMGDTEAYKERTRELIALQAHWANRLRVEAGRPLITVNQVVLN